MTNTELLKKAMSKNQQPKESTNSTTTIESFLGTLFYFRDAIHLTHLNTTSYAQHIALNEVYEEMLDTIDSLVESAQTESLLNITIPSSSTKDFDSNSVLSKCLEYIRANRNVFPHSFQANEIDNLELLLSSGIYKIKHLK